MVSVCIRTLLIYFILVFSLRLMGKRQIGELQLSELIVTILLSELAAIPIADKSIPLAYAAAPVLLLLSVEVILSYGILRLPGAKAIFVGKPSTIIQNGVLDQKELARQRTGISELLCSLRQNGIGDISDVAYAILEENGKFSIFPKASKGGVTPEQLRLETVETGISHALIIDQRIIAPNLALAGWSESQLLQTLRKRNLTPGEVFLFTVNDIGESTIILKEGKERKKQ